jgi:translation initiation factor 2 gamma subunit (eIF-2gamma)
VSKIIIVGTIGHIDHDKTALIAALTRASHEIVICEPKQIKDSLRPDPIMITKMPDFPEPDCLFDRNKKSKGEKKRERRDRRRKWGI